MPGPNKDNLPTFLKGQRLTAADLNLVVAALRQQQLVPGSFQTGAFNVQRPIAAASTGSVGPSRYGKVLIEAAANGGSTGSYVALDKDMFPLDADGNILILDSGDPEYDAGTVEAAKLDFKSAHEFAPCIVGSRISLRTITTRAAGNMSSAAVTWGEMVDVVSYLWSRANAAPGKVLFIPEDAAGPNDIDFYATECE